jgi:hypothetical protein
MPRLAGGSDLLCPAQLEELREAPSLEGTCLIPASTFIDHNVHSCGPENFAVCWWPRRSAVVDDRLAERGFAMDVVVRALDGRRMTARVARDITVAELKSCIQVLPSPHLVERTTLIHHHTLRDRRQAPSCLTHSHLKR